MKLERVDIHGFKSFADRMEIDFHQGMTAIVGPNGCGKSNVSDAIGWVLGEQSAKSLRGSKMEDFIFNGSEKRPAQSRSEVNLRVSHVRLREDDPESVEANAEVLITRRLYRSGDSEYLIDGKTCRLRDVQDLFMGTGVGAKAYAIIEQGKIGLILSSKPTDRRLLIEEAAGITKYRSRRRSAELKLSAAQQNLLRVNDIVYEIERQMRSLKRQAGKARRFRRLREDIVVVERICAVRGHERFQKTLTALRQVLKRTTDEELRRSTSLATAETFLERTRLVQADRELTLNDARDRLHQLELGIERLDHSMKRDQQQIIENDERRTQLTVELSSLETRHAPALARLEKRQQEQAEVEKELAEMEEAANRQRDSVLEHSASVAETEKRIEEHRSDFMHRVSKIAALHNFLQGVVTNSEKVAAELIKLDAELSETDNELNRVHRERSAVEQKLDTIRGRESDLKDEAVQLEAKSSETAAKLNEIESAIANGREEQTAQKARLASLEEILSTRTHFGAAARELLANPSALPFTVQGSLADAIDVAPNYVRAADGLLKDCLQRVRVATTDDAEAARQYLADNQGGAPCELIVEGLLSEDHPLRGVWRAIIARVSDKPGVLGLLSEGLSLSDPKLAVAIPEAIVVEDLAAAFDAFSEVPATYVTRQGDVVEAPGTVRIGMSSEEGGLLQTRRDARQLLDSIATSQQGLDALEVQLSELSRTRDEHGNRFVVVTGALHDLEKEMVGLDHKREQWTQEHSRFERKRQVLENERERAESERSTLASRRIEMEEGLVVEEQARSVAEQALADLASQLTERRAEGERLQQKTTEERSRVAALGERAEAVRLDVSRLGEGLKELVTRLEASRSEQVELGQRHAALEDSRARAERDLAESVESRHEVAERLGQLDESLGGYRKQIDETDRALKLRRSELDSVREARNTQEVELAKIDSDHEHLLRTFRESHEISIEQAVSLLSPAEVARPEDGLNEQLVDLKRKIDAIGAVNPMADEEFEELETRHQFVTKQRQDLLDSIKTTQAAINRIDRTSRQRFREAFVAVNDNFAGTFKQLFGGGRAGLRLLDETDVLESGIDIIAQPPGKKLQNVLLLSGGEKALTAIALLFAIFKYRPSPFCLLDEVDAPLDDANVGRFLNMLVELRDTTQFIVITHNRKTMEMADQLYGVTMEEPGVSKLVSVDLGQSHDLEESLAT